jgi:zinc protease
MAASLSPFAGLNSFGLMGRCLSSDRESYLELFADCLLNPVFPETEFDKQREVQRAALRRKQEEPFFLAAESLKQALFPDHPYRFNTEGSEESLSALTRDQLADYHRRHLGQGNLVIALFGDVEAGEAQRLAESLFNEIPEVDPLRAAATAAAAQLPQRLTRHEPKAQTMVLVGYPGVDLQDPRLDALEIIKETLGGLSSDLGIEAREKRGLVYYIGALQRTGLQPGFFALYAGTRPEAADEVESLMEQQLQRIVRDGLRPEELQRGQEQLIAQHQMSLQDNGGLAQTCALNELYGLGFDYSFGAEERIRGVGPDQIREAAAAIFQPDRRAISILLPEAADPEYKEPRP